MPASAEPSQPDRGNLKPEVTAWDILAYLGEAYIRTRSIRQTLHQLSWGLIILPGPYQNPDLELLLVWSLPQIIYSGVEALNALRLLDPDLTPKTQVHTKLLRKWESFRDDSAHYAVRLFQNEPGKHNFTIPASDKAPKLVRGFAYEFDDDKLCVGKVEGQSIYIIDALNALKAVFQDINRRFLNKPIEHPVYSQRDYNISQTIAEYERELDRDIDEFNEADAFFEERLAGRIKQIQSLLKKGSRSEEELLSQLGPKSITKAVLGLMVRDRVVRATDSDGTWCFSLAQKRPEFSSTTNKDGLK